LQSKFFFSAMLCEMAASIPEMKFEQNQIGCSWNRDFEFGGKTNAS
jgi:hypothetical protein